MKKATWTQKGVAWILVFALILPMLPLKVSADAKTDVRLETLNPALQWTSFDDFLPFIGNLENGTHTTPSNGGFSAAAEYYGNGAISKAFSGKVLNGDVIFSSNPTMLQVGMDAGGTMWNNDGTALTIYRDWSTPENALYLGFGGEVHTLTSENAKTDLVENEFNLKLSFQEMDSNDDGAKDCLQLGVWFNDVLYNNKYFMVAGDYSHYTYGFFGLRGCGGAEGSISITSCENTLDPTLEKITFSDYSLSTDYHETYGPYIPDGIYTGNYPFGHGVHIVSGKVLHGKVMFGTAPIRLKLGGAHTAPWTNEMSLSRESTTPNDALTFTFGGQEYTLTQDGAGGVDLVENEFELKVSYQEIDTDGDQVNDQLKLGIWIENRLYNDTYFYATGDYTKCITGLLGVWNGNDSASYVKLTSIRNELDTSLESITFCDFGGILDGVYSGAGNVKGGEYYATNGIATALSGKVVEGNVEFSSDTAKLRFGCDLNPGASGIWATNLQLWRKGDDPEGQLRLSLGSESEADTYILTSNLAKTELVGKKFRLQLSFQEEDSNNDGINDCLKLGVWINGILYNDQYFYVTDNYERFIYGWMMIIDTPSPGYVKLSSVIKGSLSETTIPKEYNCVTPFEFGIVNNTYPGPGAGATQAEYKCNFNTELPFESMNKVLFNTKITFDESTLLLYMRTEADEWSGLELKADTGGGFYLVNHLTGNYEIWSDAEKVATADKAWYFIDPKTAIEGANSLIGVSFYLAITTEFIACDEDGVANDLKLGIWFNDKLYNQQYFYIKDSLDVCQPGLLLCRMAEGGIVLESPSTMQREETNERYNLGDGPYLISGTGTILVNDVEYRNGDTLTEPGAYRIVSDNGALVRNVELYDAEKKSSAVMYEENVMPLVGFYGPHSGADVSGQEFNSVTEETYQLLQQAKINLINYIPKDWSGAQESQAELIRNLTYAEQYNIGMYIWDSALLTSELDAETIAKNIAPYSQYDSFKGIHVVDEPGTDSYYSTVERQLDTYAQLAKAVNGYCNLNGYINLFPYAPSQLIAEGYSASEYQSRYGDYLDEYISKTEARLLSYDNYVFATSRPKYYFVNLSLAREKSLNAGIPFWSYIQVGNNWCLDMGDSTRTPLTEEQFMWNVNTSLAYGTKGIQYYPLIEPYFESGSHEGDGVLDTNGMVTKWYESVAKINTHITAIDNVLMKAESKAVLAVGQQAQSDTAISATSYGNLETVLLDKANTQGTVIGAFDYQGKDAFYVVNYDTEKEETITLKFKGTDAYEYRMVQNAVTSYGQGTSCQLTIPAGEAVLVVLNDSAISNVKLQAEITDSIAMIYWATLNQEVAKTERPYMIFEADGKASEKVFGVLEDVDKGIYTFTYPDIMAQDMAKTVKATLVFGEYSRNYENSVLVYCARLLNADVLQNDAGINYTEQQMEELKNLVVDLVKYGAAVQIYRNSEIANEDLLTNKLEGMLQQGKTSAMFDKPDKANLDELTGIIADNLSQFNGMASYMWQSVTLVLKDKINLRTRFKADNLKGLSVKVSVAGKEVYLETLSEIAVSEGNGVWRLDFDDIYSYEYGRRVEIAFCDENGVAQGATLLYSVNTYLNHKKAHSNQLNNLLLAINAYGDAALSYYTAVQ